MKVNFVVLHYGDPKMTEQSIQSILSLKPDHLGRVVIIDNDSQKRLEKPFSQDILDNQHVEYVDSGGNLGFAKGNNLGFSLLKKEAPQNLAVFLNNDVLIEDPDFIEKLICSYNQHHFQLAGPDIVNLDGVHQNPFRETVQTVDDVKQRIHNKESLLKLYQIQKRIPGGNKINLLKKLYDQVSKKRLDSITNNSLQKDVVLQGSAVIVAPDFIEREEFLFYPHTFMYGEEDILAYLAKSKGYISVYDPSLRVTHLDGVSTKGKHGKDASREIFFLKESIKSSRILLELMESQK